MTRFDAATPADRRALFADAVRAHRERDSPFLTIEPEPTPAEVAAADDEDLPPDAPEQTVPWLQLAGETVNLDCTDAELESLKTLLEEYPDVTVAELTRPEDAFGTNVRLTARGDPERLAGLFDRVFRAVYGRAEDYRAWVVAV
ncbi:MAG: hypothetical protein ABEJ31_04260 [Haloarculaceae archaeon]